MLRELRGGEGKKYEKNIFRKSMSRETVGESL